MPMLGSRIEAVPWAREGSLCALADQAPVPIGVWDQDRRCVYVNRCGLESTGQSFEQAFGDGWIEGLHPDDLDLCLAAYDWAGEAPQGLRVAHRLQRRDGAYRWVARRGLACVDVWGRFQGHIAFWLDVTERTAAERALANDKALCRSSVESLPGPAAVVAKDGRVLAAHGAWMPFGREDATQTDAFALGANYREACHRAMAQGDGEARAALQGLESVLAGRSGRFVWEHPCPGADPERWFELVIYPLKRPVNGAVLLHLEVTQRHWAEAFVQSLAQRNQTQAERSLQGLLRHTPNAFRHAWKLGAESRRR